MKIGIMYSGIGQRNGADFVAEFMINAVKLLGHECVVLGSHGGPQATEIPDGLDFIVHSSGRELKLGLVYKLKKKTKVVLWTHNDEMEDWRQIIAPISPVVDIHFSYTKGHPYGDHVRYLPLAADETIYHPIDAWEAFYEYDVALIGARRSWREKFAEGIQKSFPKAFFHFEMALTHEEVNRIYNSTRVVLAPVQDCDEDSPARAWGCPCRTFDVPASGAFQIQVARGGLYDVYPEAIVIDPIEDVDVAVDAWSEVIDYYITHEEVRLYKATELWVRTRAQHKYTHRIQTMIDAIEELAG